MGSSGAYLRFLREEPLTEIDKPEAQKDETQASNDPP